VGNFFVFNVADSFITVGVIVLLIGIWLEDKREKAQKKLATSLEQPADDLNRSNP